MRPTDVTSINDVDITRLGLGSAPLGGLFFPVSEADARATVGAAYDLGLRFFDTAPLYGYGNAEQRVGAALASYERDSFALATKVGRLLRVVPAGQHQYDVDQTQFHDGEPFYKATGEAVPVFDFSYDGALRSLEESLERLGTDRVDIVHVHDPEGHVDIALGGAVRALTDLREQGVIGAVGVGIDHAEPATRFAEEADIDCLLIAGRWTLLDHRAGERLLPAALRNDVAIIAAGVFNSGILADPARNKTFDYVPCPPEIAARAQLLADVCRRFEVPLPAAAIQFPWRHPAVRAVVVGARTPAELVENVGYASHEIPPEMWAALEAECGVPSSLGSSGADG